MFLTEVKELFMQILLLAQAAGVMEPARRWKPPS